MKELLMVQNDEMPPKSPEETTRLNLLVPTRVMRRIDAWRRKQPQLQTLSEVVRQVMDAGIEALENHHDKPKKKP
jgi:hypothetical protein